MKNQGFSLLELSIVLVIIGLLAGGVLVGQELVKQSEIRSILSNISQVQTAVTAFKNKYDASPGDMRNATDYWGTAATCPATSAAPLTSVATCNGNGNGTLYPAEINATSPEWFLFWDHLANSGLYEGVYTGASVAAANTTARPATNVPETKISGVGITAFSFDMPQNNNASWWYGNYRLFLVIGKELATNATATPAFAPADMMSIDTKLDNGMPGSGIVRSLKNVNCVAGVVATSSQSTSVYDLTQTSPTCTLTYSLSGDPSVIN